MRIQGCGFHGDAKEPNACGAHVFFLGSPLAAREGEARWLAIYARMVFVKSILFANSGSHKWIQVGASHRFNWITWRQVLTPAAGSSCRMKAGSACINHQIKENKESSKTNKEPAPDDDDHHVMKADRNKCYSLLYLSGRYGSLMRAVIVPKIDLILKDVVNDHNNNASLKRRLSASNGYYILSDDRRLQFNLHQLKAEVGHLIELRSKLKALRVEIKSLPHLEGAANEEQPADVVCSEKLANLKEEARRLTETVWDMEDKLMPIVLQLPNGLRDDVPEACEVHVVKCIEPKRKNFKILDHQRLAYINETMHSSIIGPSPYYFCQRGAQLHHALVNFFSSSLRRSQFLDFSGLDFVKTAIVEACNDVSERNYANDTLRVHIGSRSRPDTQQTHLVGDSSLEALCSFVVSWLAENQISTERLPLRYFSVGSAYDQKLQQANTVNCISVTRDNLEASNEEMELLAHVLWSCYSALQIPCRLVKCGDKYLTSPEYARYSFDLWLPSSKSWQSVARISHYRHFLPHRLGLENVHLIDAVAMDSKEVISSIVENNQTISGTFDFPTCLQI